MPNPRRRRPPTARSSPSPRSARPIPPSPLAATFGLAYRGLVANAAFALARDAEGRSAWGYVGGAADPALAEAAALERCRRSLGQLQAECRMLASDAGRPGGPAVPLAEGSIGPFRWAPLLLRRGPQAARGVLVWGHGYGGPDRDNRNRPTPPFVTLLNDNGWDVLRFDRHPGDDGLYASLPRLVGGLPALKPGRLSPHPARRPVARRLAGHHGGQRAAGPGRCRHRHRPGGAWRMGPQATTSAPRWTTSSACWPGCRKARAWRWCCSRATTTTRTPSAAPPCWRPGRRDRRAPTLALWPEPPLRGHAAAGDLRFTLDYAGCLLSLVQAPEAAAPRGMRRAACGGG